MKTDEGRHVISISSLYVPMCTSSYVPETHAHSPHIQSHKILCLNDSLVFLSETMNSYKLY